MEQGDNVTYMLEKDRERLKQEVVTAVHYTLHTYIHPFNGPLSRTTWVSRYQKGKTNLYLLEQDTVSSHGWHWLGHMQICISPHTDNHACTRSFLQAGTSSPTNSVKALKAKAVHYTLYIVNNIVHCLLHMTAESGS